MRNKVIAGNWKMNMDVASGTHLIDAIVSGVREMTIDETTDVVLCPPFVLLSIAESRLAGSSIKLGAQNVHWAPNGAYTGEVSIEMLRSTGCRYVIVGHSERRLYSGETDLDVQRKANAVIDAGMMPIICVGETAAEREHDQVESVIERQIRTALDGILDFSITSCVIAYEPVWAIGTGNTATPEQAEAVHRFIRTMLTDLYSEAKADNVSIIYGGSINRANAAELFAQPDIDGGLVGGASLDADSFLAIVNAAL